MEVRLVLAFVWLTHAVGPELSAPAP